MVCHGELARSRPAAEKLTEFYLWLSLGGGLGGLLNAMLAPLLFTRVIEYPLAIVMACALSPPLLGGGLWLGRLLSPGRSASVLFVFGELVITALGAVFSGLVLFCCGDGV